MTVRVNTDHPNNGGSLTATKEHCNGGTFSSVLTVCPVFTFVKVGDPGEIRVLDICEEGLDPIEMELFDQGWVHDPGVNVCIDNPVCSAFHPGLDTTDPDVDCDCQPNGVRDDCDIEDETSEDCNGNGIPDECDVRQSVGCPIGTCTPTPCTIDDDCPEGETCDAGFCTNSCSEDCNENCVPDECEPDTDNDGVIDDCDNCPDDANPDQEDLDNDGIGDACDPDADGDGFEGPLGDGSDCDDMDPDVNPGVEESAAQGNCDDGLDNDCDGNTDAADPDCP